MREQINHSDFSGECYGVTEDVRAYRAEFLGRDGEVGMRCDYMPMSSRVLAASMAHWASCDATVRLREIGPHFQRSQFPSFEVNLLLTRDRKAQVEARKVWEQYIGWKTICTTAAAGEGLVG